MEHKGPSGCRGCSNGRIFQPVLRQAHDAPEGRRLLQALGPTSRPIHLLMDRAYEGNETRQLALDLGFIPVVPPIRTRRTLGNMTGPCTGVAMKSRGYFGGSRATAESFLGSRSSTRCSLGFLSFILVVEGLRGLC